MKFLAVALFAGVASVAHASGSDQRAALHRRQNIGGAVVVTPTAPAAGANTPVDTALDTAVDTALDTAVDTALDTAVDTALTPAPPVNSLTPAVSDTAIVPGTATTPTTHVASVTPTTPAAATTPTSAKVTTPAPTPATTPQTKAPVAAATTSPTHTTPTPAKVTTPTTPEAAATTSDTTTIPPVGGVGAAGGGGGDLPPSTTPPANVMTATQGSGGLLDYGSCIEFESQCNTLCSYGIYSMDCFNGGICLCYKDDPNDTDSGSEVDGSDDSTSGGRALRSYSIWGLSATALPALAVLAVTGMLF
ncbi:hypothetical protein IW136_000024 [Coemansia sp. RSA 678]|nr:hypothetical protein IW136_000024 [Coemansia sp. RSA 678]